MDRLGSGLTWVFACIFLSAAQQSLDAQVDMVIEEEAPVEIKA